MTWCLYPVCLERKEKADSMGVEHTSTRDKLYIHAKITVSQSMDRKVGKRLELGDTYCRLGSENY